MTSEASSRQRLFVLAVAVVWAASNLAKPLTIDDAAYWMFARHMAGNPADPYGFTMFWYQSPQPAIEVLAPPVWPYWWSSAIRWLGSAEWAWKLWQFPFVYLFVAACASLARRFAPGPHAVLLPAFLVLSPVFLPGLNLMLDVPALALGLASLAMFAWASDRDSHAAAVAAGVVAGLAMQTKYTGLLAPVVMVLYAVVIGRIGLGVSAALAAAAVFASWETAVWWRYGQSQFVAALSDAGGGASRRWATLQALPAIVGGVGSAWGCVALAALGIRRRLVVGAMAASIVAFVSLGWVPDRMSLPWPAPLAALLGRTEFHINPALDLSRLLGAFVLVALSVVLVRTWRDRDRGVVFLLAWLVVEAAGYVLLNPFVAARRVMGLAVVAALVLWRFANLTCRSSERRQLLRAVLIYNAALALMFAVTDRSEAVAQRDGARQAAAAAREGASLPGSRLWYVGHWGFQFYAEQEGLAPVVPGVSVLRRGDMVVVPGPPVDAQRVRLPSGRVAPVATMTVADAIPWRTLPGYYRGAVPLAARGSPPRLRVSVVRVLDDFVAEPERPREATGR